MRPIRIGIAVVLAGIAASASAQRAAPEWGTQDAILKVIYATEFDPVASATAFGDDFASRFGLAAGSKVFAAAVHLPAGAVVSTLELEGCDEVDNGEIEFFLQALASPVGVIGTPLSGTTGFAATPACNFFFDSGFVQIENLDTVHRVVVILDGPAGPGLRFRAVRLFYRLQVSPLAPGPAVFDDVPVGHPFRRFIEALYDAGITGGCGASPLRFCPDNPISRGEMAVFLAVALGLHFPN